MSDTGFQRMRNACARVSVTEHSVPPDLHLRAGLGQENAAPRRGFAHRTSAQASSAVYLAVVGARGARRQRTAATSCRYMEYASHAKRSSLQRAAKRQPMHGASSVTRASGWCEAGTP
jgi:hypothetical protein